MVVTLGGMSTLVRFSQPENACFTLCRICNAFALKLCVIFVDKRICLGLTTFASCRGLPLETVLELAEKQ